MGNKDSKPCVLSYEDAVKRIKDEELKRLRDTFKRSSVGTGYITSQIFVKDVWTERVPSTLAEQLYRAFGGNYKGLMFKELLCGLVLLTHGTQEEKIKFVFSLYANEMATHIHKEDMEKLIMACDGHLPQSLSALFTEADKASYEQFKHWLLTNRDSLTLTCWLLQEGGCTGLKLSDESQTPTFYQTLAGVTHLEEKDIIELEKRYWQLKAQSKSGKFDLETFIPLVSPPIPQELCEGVFNAFDENMDNHIDFKEISCGLSACCRGPTAERQKFCFKVFDKDRDGLLSRQELEEMVAMLDQIKIENERDLSKLGNSMNTQATVADILETYDSNKDDYITLEEYQMWSVNNKLPNQLLTILFQICHIVLGLRPVSAREEGEIVRGWLERERRRGLQQGQVWYLVASGWWKSWNCYVDNKPLQSPQVAALGSNGQANKTHSLPRKVPGYAMAQANHAPATTATLDSRGLSQSQPSSPTDRGRVKGSPAPAPALRRASVPRPGAINNLSLATQDIKKVATLTNEGQRLRRSPSLVHHQDYEILPEPVWKALYLWYGGAPVLPRTVITSPGRPKPELELYPITVQLYRHQTVSRAHQNHVPAVSLGFVGGFSFAQATSSLMGGGGGGGSGSPAPPRRHLAHAASFSKMHTLQQVHDFLVTRLRIKSEDLRLWNLKDEHNPILWEELSAPLYELGVTENHRILIEVRNKDMSWPEEILSLAAHKNKQDKKKQVTTEKGCTGLNNLGNTCFMNSALQCISNTPPLTMYFNGERHLYELNRTNPLGMKGHIARRYGDLVQELWSGTAKTVAPLKLRWTIGKYAPRFNGFQQHDSQELLAFLLDGLHEDLNRVHHKPYVELKDSDGRPDEEVAKEAWENHVIRNKSVIVDLFHGQLKSQVICKTCNHVSVRFDPFTYLSLPLPMDSSMHLEITVTRLDGTVPTKYGLRLNMDDKYRDLKQQLGQLGQLKPSQLLLVEVFGNTIRSMPQDSQKIRTLLGGSLFAYQVVDRDIEPPSSQPDGADGSHSDGADGGHSVSCNGGGDELGVAEPAGSPEPVEESPSQPSNGSAGGYRATAPPAEGGRPATRRGGNGTGAGGLYSTPYLGAAFDGFIIAVHRKMIRMDMYFLSYQKERLFLFGTPLIIPCVASTRQCALYQSVWTQVSRLVSPLPPSENGINLKNHAQDCDDSLGYEYPFVLKAVQKDGLTCATCPWYRFCTGCKIECSEDDFEVGSSYIAIDWDPTALHLRYQTSQEKVVEDHGSVEESRLKQSEPINLETCLQAFTSEEELGDEDTYYCSKCKDHQQATKKLDIWKLPPFLIVHMKRFQFVNGRWVKSGKIVQFPKRDFDASNFLVPRDNDTPDGTTRASSTPFSISVSTSAQGLAAESAATVRSNSCHSLGTPRGSSQDRASSPRGAKRNSVSPLADPGGRGEAGSPPGETDGGSSSSTSSHKGSLESLRGSQLSLGKRNAVSPSRHSQGSGDSDGRGEGGGGGGGQKNQRHFQQRSSSSLSQDSVLSEGLPAAPRFSPTLTTPVDVTDAHPLLIPKGSESDGGSVPLYDLYAVSCHTGILGGGHYVAYCRSSNGKWYCYNDSSVKEIQEEQIDTDNAYMLFYQQQGMDYKRFMPDIVGRTPDRGGLEDELENDNKMCSVQ